MNAKEPPPAEPPKDEQQTRREQVWAIDLNRTTREIDELRRHPPRTK